MVIAYLVMYGDTVTAAGALVDVPTDLTVTRCTKYNGGAVPYVPRDPEGGHDLARGPDSLRG